MSAPLFSVVTVTLNCAAEACRTAKSVLEQDFDDYEYLVKDGQSCDETVPQLQRMGVGQIAVSKDGGIYAAMNQALDLCKGRYVWYLNAGDTFASPKVLSEFARHIQAHDFPAFLYGDLQTMEPHQVWKNGGGPDARMVQLPGKLTRFYLYHRTICHQAWAVERTLYRRCGGLDESLRFVADYDFLLKAFLRLHVSYSRVPCMCVTYAAGGFSERYFELAKSETHQILRRHFPPWERWPYEGLRRVGRLLVYGPGLSRLHRYLPAKLQARLAGL